MKESRPGQRYQDHYHRRRRRFSSGRSVLRAIFGIVGGLLIVVVGLVAVPGPGPGWLIILLGLGMIAGESLSFARLIDRAEVRLRQMTRRVVDVWTASHALVKVSIALTVFACGVALGYGIYYLIFW